MTRTILFILGGVLLGGIIHIVIVFLVPLYAGNDAWAEMGRFGPDRQFHMLPAPEAGAEPIPGMDPRMLQAVCRFDLGNGPLRVQAELPDEFWSVAVFDRRGRNVYSLNDRAAEGQKLDLAILTAVQMAQLRQSPPASLENAIVVDLPIQAGFVLLRAFIPDDSMLPSAHTALAGANCSGTF
ncbi:MAG: DUF1254 domain-containing protein [Bauldia sp.]